MLLKLLLIIVNCFVIITATEIDTGNVILRNNTEFKIAPILIDSNAIGSLDISTYPNDVDVYVNGIPVGKGSKVITGLKPGKYIINAKYKDKTYQKDIYIEADKCTIIGIKLERRTQNF
jgi:hypothetical protein